MVKLSLHPTFIKDSLLVFKERGLKGLLFGTTAALKSSEQRLLNDVHADFENFQNKGARSGNLTKIDAIHKGSGKVYLLPDTINSDPKASLLLFDESTKITNGPDLWIYLSDSKNPKKTLGKFHDLGLIKGNKGGQLYCINKSLKELSDCQTVIVHCKQFNVLFSYAVLE